MARQKQQPSLLLCLLLLILLHGTGASVLVAREAHSTQDLAQRVADGGLYVIGYCRAPGDGDCDALHDLLAAADAAQQSASSSSSSPVTHMLLLHPPPADWRSSLSHSQHATALWFACHDGSRLQLAPLADPSAEADAAEEPWSSWYLNPDLSAADRLDLLQLAASQAMETQKGAACVRRSTQQQQSSQQEKQQQSSGRGSGGVRAFLRKACNTLLLLLAVFAAGRFWPQLSDLCQQLAGAAGQQPASRASAPAPAAASKLGSAGDQGRGLTAAQLISAPPSSGPSSLPSAPTTPAHGVAPGPLAGAGLAAAPPPLRTLSTATSIDQLQMDNAQLAELVSQLHAEVGGSKAAAADASAAVQRQEAATHEALSCLQEQLVDLDNRISAVEEFGTAFNAAAVAAAAVEHRQQQLEGDTGTSSSVAGAAAPFAAGARAVVAPPPPAAAAAAAARETASSGSSRQLAAEVQRSRFSKPSSSGAAAAAAAAAAASAAATAAAAAARGGAATEAALQQLCDLLVRQGVATVGALESLSAHVRPAGAGAADDPTTSSSSSSKGVESVVGAAAEALSSQLVLMREATVAIAALSDELRGIRPVGVGSAAGTDTGVGVGADSSSKQQQQQQQAEGELEPVGLPTPDKAAASTAARGVPAAQAAMRPLALSSGDRQDQGLVLSPAAAQQAAAGKTDAEPAVSASDLTWAELQDRIRTADKHSASQQGHKVTPASAAGAALPCAGSDRWEVAVSEAK